VDNDDDGYDDQFDDELDDDDEAPRKKKRVATSTKIVLVVAGWILLTLFLVGEFSENRNKPDTASAELETTTEEFDDGGTPDIVDTEAEAEFDLDGDGFLDEAERGAALEAFEASVEAGEVAIGESDVSESEGSGGGGGTYPGPDGETATPAVPGAAPSGGSGSSTTTTAKPGGGGSPTTTAAPTTTKPGGGGGTTSTTPTTAAPPPPPTTEAPGDPVALNVTASGFLYQYPAGYSKNLSLPAGSTISFKNTEASANIDHSFSIVNGWDSGVVNKNSAVKTSPELAKGSYEYRCKVHPTTMNGTLTVT
jgi:plastocyanin